MKNAGRMPRIFFVNESFLTMSSPRSDLAAGERNGSLSPMLVSSPSERGRCWKNNCFTARRFFA